MSIFKSTAIFLGLLIATYALIETSSEEKRQLWSPQEAMPNAEEGDRIKWQGN